MRPAILLIEDELSISQNIACALEQDGFSVHAFGTGHEGLAHARSNGPALAIVDLGLPDTSGFEVGRELVQKCGIPVIFLTARGEEVDRVSGLELGADDYVVKPVSLRELSARVRAVLRRSKQSSGTSLVGEEPSAKSRGKFTIDDQKKRIFFSGQELSLSKIEYQLLSALINNSGRVLSREQLMNLAWDDPNMSLERTVDAHVKALRAKLAQVAPDEEVIVTHRGFGYSIPER